jgi:hypothetical protein
MRNSILTFIYLLVVCFIIIFSTYYFNKNTTTEAKIFVTLFTEYSQCGLFNFLNKYTEYTETKN